MKFKTGDWVVVGGKSRQVMSGKWDGFWGCFYYTLRHENALYPENLLISEEIYNSPLYKALHEEE